MLQFYPIGPTEPHRRAAESLTGLSSSVIYFSSLDDRKIYTAEYVKKTDCIRKPDGSYMQPGELRRTYPIDFPESYSWLLPYLPGYIPEQSGPFSITRAELLQILEVFDSYDDALRNDYERSGGLNKEDAALASKLRGLLGDCL